MSYRVMVVGLRGCCNYNMFDMNKYREREHEKFTYVLFVCLYVCVVCTLGVYIYVHVVVHYASLSSLQEQSWKAQIVTRVCIYV